MLIFRLHFDKTLLDLFTVEDRHGTLVQENFLLMKAQSIQKIASDWISSQSPCTQTLHTKQQLIYRPAEGGSHNDSAEYILLFHFVRQVTGWVQNPYASSNIGTISPEW